MLRLYRYVLSVTLAVSGFAAPSVQTVWVDPIHGSDSNTGASREEALETIEAAWARIPSGQTLTAGFRILLAPGVYSEVPDLKSRWGTPEAPVIVEAADGSDSIMLPPLRISNSRYLLLRSIRAGSVSVVRSQHIGIVDSDIEGAAGDGVSLSAVEDSGIAGNRIRSAAGWCVNAAGGTMDVRLEGNTFDECGFSGFAVGQESGSELNLSSGAVYEYSNRLANPAFGPRAAIVMASPLTATPGALRFVYTTGGTAPAPQAVSLTAASGTSFQVTAATATGASWLSVNPGGGTTPASVNVSVNPATLAANAYTGTVTAAVSGAQPLEIPVVLVVFTPGSATQVFNDVPVTHPWLDYIYLLGKFGVSVGCTAQPPLYCPADNVTQAQMAAFVIRAMLGETFSYPTTPYFADLPASNPLFKYVQKMRELNINPGCGSGQFCPNSLVTRGQMAQYLVRARFGDTFPYPTTARFNDVGTADSLFPYVQKLWDMGVTQGCTDTTYCPAQNVNREQMAAFLTRTFFAFGVLTPSQAPTPAGTAPQIAGCNIFPADNVWNTPIDTLPVHASSSLWVNTIGASRIFHADFGSGLWDGGPIGIPYVVVPQGQAKVSVSFDYADESDPGPYPIPANPPIEGGANSTGDRHILILEQGACKLYELYYAYPQSNGTWTAGSGAIYDLKSNGPLRPQTWTSADAAGLPMLPGLVRYDEFAAGEIKHAIRFTAPQTRNQFLWPARHQASGNTGAQYPPMGARFRLKAGYDISGFSTKAQIILKAMKKYGIILADNGSSWYIGGVPDEHWDNNMLHELDRVTGANMEAVDESSLIIDINSGQARQP